MAELNEIRLTCSPEITKHPHYKEDELRRIIMEVIKHSTMPAFYKTEVRGHNDSPNTVKTTRVRAGKYDRATSKMPVFVTLIGCHEKWIVDICPSKAAQGDLESFANGIKEAATKVEAEELKIHLGETKGADQPAPPAAPDNKPGAVPEKKRQKKAAKRMVAHVIQDDMLVIMLKHCLAAGGTKRVLNQSDFLAFVKDLNLDCSTLLIPKYLARKGLLEIIPISRKPQLKVTDQGYNLVFMHEQEELAKQAQKEELEREKAMIQFAHNSLSSLTNLRGLKTLSEENEKLQDQIAAKKKLISELTARLADEQKELAALEKSRQTTINGIFTHLGRINGAKLNDLIGLAKGQSK